MRSDWRMLADGICSIVGAEDVEERAAVCIVAEVLAALRATLLKR